MLTFNSTGEPGASRAEIFFPNRRGVSILRTKIIGEPDVFEVAELFGTPEDNDLDFSTVETTDEAGCDEMLERIRILIPEQLNLQDNEIKHKNRRRSRTLSG